MKGLIPFWKAQPWPSSITVDQPLVGFPKFLCLRPTIESFYSYDLLAHFDLCKMLRRICLNNSQAAVGAELKKFGLRYDDLLDPMMSLVSAARLMFADVLPLYGLVWYSLALYISVIIISVNMHFWIELLHSNTTNPSTRENDAVFRSRIWLEVLTHKVFTHVMCFATHCYATKFVFKGNLTLFWHAVFFLFAQFRFLAGRIS